MTIPEIGSLWQHVARKTVYRITGHGTIQASTVGLALDDQPAVSYVPVNGGKTYYREVTEFLDGRFVQVNTDLKKTGLRLFSGSAAGRCDVIVLAKSTAAAHRALNAAGIQLSIGYINTYWSKNSQNEEDLAVVMPHPPGTVFMREGRFEPWQLLAAAAETP